MLQALLDHERETGRPIPSHPFDLVAYIRDGVGKHMTEEQQRQLYAEVATYHQQTEQQPTQTASNVRKGSIVSGAGTTKTHTKNAAGDEADANNAAYISPKGITMAALAEHNRLNEESNTRTDNNSPTKVDGAFNNSKNNMSIPMIGVLGASIGDLSVQVEGEGDERKESANAVGNAAFAAKQPASNANVNSNIHSRGNSFDSNQPTVVGHNNSAPRRLETGITSVAATTYSPRPEHGFNVAPPTNTNPRSARPGNNNNVNSNALVTTRGDQQAHQFSSGHSPVGRPIGTKDQLVTTRSVRRNTNGRRSTYDIGLSEENQKNKDRADSGAIVATARSLMNGGLNADTTTSPARGCGRGARGTPIAIISHAHGVKGNGTVVPYPAAADVDPSCQNAAANPSAAKSNANAVGVRMTTISRALAITAANPEQELTVQLRHVGITRDGEDEADVDEMGVIVNLSEADLEAVSTVGAYILIPDEDRCPDATSTKAHLKKKVDAAPKQPIITPAPVKVETIEDGNADASVEGSAPVAAPTTTTTVNDEIAEVSSETGDSNYCPTMASDKRYHCRVPLHQMSKDDPFYIYETAELKVEQSNPCTSDWYAAAEAFERAGQAFASFGIFRMAANCEVRQYDCLKATGRLDDAGEALVAASHYYTQESLVDDSSSHRESGDAALAAMQNAIGLYDELGRDVTAAKLCTEAAELCIKARNPGLGVDVLHVAATTFLATGQVGYAEKCLTRAAEIAILDMSDFPEAITTLEQLAKITPTFKQHLAFFKALICRFVCIPPEQGIQFVIAMEDCQKTLDLYTDVCPQLLSAMNEYKLVREILETQKHMEDDRLEVVISKYLLGNKIGLEQWVVLMLKKIHENLVQRKLSVEKLYKLA